VFVEAQESRVGNREHKTLAGPILSLSANRNRALKLLTARLGAPSVQVDTGDVPFAAWRDDERAVCGTLTDSAHQDKSRFYLRHCPSIRELVGQGSLPLFGFSKPPIGLSSAELTQALEDNPMAIQVVQRRMLFGRDTLDAMFWWPPELVFPFTVSFAIADGHVVGYRCSFIFEKVAPDRFVAALKPFGLESLDDSVHSTVDGHALAISSDVPGSVTIAVGE
jgi:hypothetical protein